MMTIDEAMARAERLIGDKIAAARRESESRLLLWGLTPDDVDDALGALDEMYAGIVAAKLAEVRALLERDFPKGVTSVDLVRPHVAEDGGATRRQIAEDSAITTH